MNRNSNKHVQKYHERWNCYDHLKNKANELNSGQNNLFERLEFFKNQKQKIDDENLFNQFTDQKELSEKGFAPKIWAQFFFQKTESELLVNESEFVKEISEFSEYEEPLFKKKTKKERGFEGAKLLMDIVQGVRQISFKLGMIVGILAGVIGFNLDGSFQRAFVLFLSWIFAGIVVQTSYKLLIVKPEKDKEEQKLKVKQFIQEKLSMQVTKLENEVNDLNKSKEKLGKFASMQINMTDKEFTSECLTLDQNLSKYKSNLSQIGLISANIQGDNPEQISKSDEIRSAKSALETSIRGDAIKILSVNKKLQDKVHIKDFDKIIKNITRNALLNIEYYELSGSDLKSFAQKEAESAINQLKLELTANQNESINLVSIKTEFKTALSDRILSSCKNDSNEYSENEKWLKAQKDFDVLKLKSVKIVRKYSDILELRLEEINNTNKDGFMQSMVEDAFCELQQLSGIGDADA